MRRPCLIIGHRGARGLYPENTLTGFAGALALGVDALELDVALTDEPDARCLRGMAGRGGAANPRDAGGRTGVVRCRPAASRHGVFRTVSRTIALRRGAHTDAGACAAGP